MLALLFYAEGGSGGRRDAQAGGGSGQDNDAVPMALKRDYDSMGQRNIKVNKRRDGDSVANNEIEGEEEGDMPVISNEYDDAARDEKKKPQRQRWRKKKPIDNKNGKHWSSGMGRWWSEHFHIIFIKCDYLMEVVISRETH